MSKACQHFPKNEELPDKDCYLIGLLKAHNDIEKVVHQKSGAEKRILTKYLHSLDEQIDAAAKVATCFPNECDICAGLSRCLNCEHKNLCTVKKCDSRAYEPRLASPCARATK